MTRIAATIVGTDDDRFRCVEANDERLKLARCIATFTQGDGGADVVMLPAGFLAASEEVEVKQNAKSLAAIFKRQVLLAGVDEEDDESTGSKGGKNIRHSGKAGKGGKSEEAPDNSKGYPYWGFASDAGKIIGGPWRQRSARFGQETSDTKARCVRVGSASIGLLICGELYNPALADGLAEAKPDLVVDLAHLSMKRFTKSLHRVAKTVRSPVFHVQHVALNAGYASKWRATSRGGAQADSECDWASYTEPGWKADALWAEVKIWEV